MRTLMRATGLPRELIASFVSMARHSVMTSLLLGAICVGCFEPAIDPPAEDAAIADTGTTPIDGGSDGGVADDENLDVSFDAVTPGCTREGCLRKLEYLGTLDVESGSHRQLAMYYVEIYSGLGGGTRLGAKLYYPIGESLMPTGFPAQVLAPPLGGPGRHFDVFPVRPGSEADPHDWLWNDMSRLSRWGLATLAFFPPGAGPSQPLSGQREDYFRYSPISVGTNARAAYQMFLVLRQLDGMERPGSSGARFDFDLDRLVFHSICVSSHTLIEFSRLYATDPRFHIPGLRALLSDTFQPSTAYISQCVAPGLSEMSDADDPPLCRVTLAETGARLGATPREVEEWALSNCAKAKAAAMVSINAAVLFMRIVEMGWDPSIFWLS